MDLFTRCPDCDTVFRVTTRHLQASGGQVRCGRCDAVFDAFASLTAKPPGVSQAHSAGVESQSNSVDEATAVAPFADPSTLSDAVFAKTEDNTPEPATTPAQKGHRRIADESETNLYEWEFKPAPKLRRSGLWLSLSMLLLVSGLIQAGYLFRTEIMVNVPQVKSLYQQACRWLSCEIGLPRLADCAECDTRRREPWDRGARRSR